MNRHQRRARQRSARPPQAPDERTEALRSIAATMTRADEEIAIRKTAIEIARGMQSLLEFDLLDLDPQRRALAERAIVLYCEAYLKHHGVDSTAWCKPPESQPTNEG